MDPKPMTNSIGRVACATIVSFLLALSHGGCSQRAGEPQAGTTATVASKPATTGDTGTEWQEAAPTSSSPGEPTAATQGAREGTRVDSLVQLAGGTTKGKVVSAVHSEST